jgi:hypothetical protein
MVNPRWLDEVESAHHDNDEAEGGIERVFAEFPERDENIFFPSGPGVIAALRQAMVSPTVPPYWEIRISRRRRASTRRQKD